MTVDPPIDRSRIALGVQQPWAELILRGIKTIEVRSQPTQVRGTIYLYTSKRPSSLEAAAIAAEAHALNVTALPAGLLVGTIDILDSRPCTPQDVAASCVPADLLVNRHAWIIGRPHRFAKPQPVRFLPYGVWFYPFQRKGQ
ncbi:MAG TPA: ASCH domain-containing protein [Planctomycetaceae bacterium]|nr:ASCH domain-containing protein [Planctomycetaceae bacterium]